MYINNNELSLNKNDQKHKKSNKTHKCKCINNDQYNNQYKKCNCIYKYVYLRPYNSNNNSNNNNNNNTNNNFIIINLLNTRLEAIYLDFKPVVYFSWLQTEFNKFKNGKVIFSVVVRYGSCLEIQMYDETNNKILGSHDNIDQSSVYTFPIVNPSNDAIMSVRLKKISDHDINPEIYGIILKYEL